jgi:hypothetical protein
MNHLPKFDVLNSYGMENMLSIGRRFSRWASGAMCVVLAGTALADGVSGNVLIAAIAPTLPVEVVPPIPEPAQYVFHYTMQYSAPKAAVLTFNPAEFYTVPALAAEPFRAPGAQTRGLSLTYRQPFMPQTQQQLSRSGFGAVRTTQSVLDMFQLTEDDTVKTSRPQRRLAMMINDWRVSASAHLPLTHPHDAGATVRIQHKF